MERFAGINICSFSPIKAFTEILSRCLGQRCTLLNRRAYNHEKTFSVLLKTVENAKFSPVNLSLFTVVMWYHSSNNFQHIWSTVRDAARMRVIVYINLKALHHIDYTLYGCSIFVWQVKLILKRLNKSIGPYFSLNALYTTSAMNGNYCA